MVQRSIYTVVCNEIYICRVCSSNYSTKASLVTHMRLEHGEYTDIYMRTDVSHCLICGKQFFSLARVRGHYADAPRCNRLLMLNFEPLSQGALDQVSLDDALHRARMLSLGFPENKVLSGEAAIPCSGPSPRFLSPPRSQYILGWFYARRRVYFNITDPASFGGPLDPEQQ